MYTVIFGCALECLHHPNNDNLWVLVLQIFVPLHEEANGGHWFLMVVHPMTLVAEIWDSSPSIEMDSSRLATARAAVSINNCICILPLAIVGHDRHQFSVCNKACGAKQRV